MWRGKKALARFHRMSRNLLQEVQKKRRQGQLDPDTIAGRLLSIVDPSTKKPLPDDVLAPQFGIFFAAGATSASFAGSPVHHRHTTWITSIACVLISRCAFAGHVGHCHTTWITFIACVWVSSCAFPGHVGHRRTTWISFIACAWVSRCAFAGHVDHRMDGTTWITSVACAWVSCWGFADARRALCPCQRCDSFSCDSVAKCGHVPCVPC